MKNFKGRGAQINTDNPFSEVKQCSHPDLIFSNPDSSVETQYLPTHPKTIVNKVESPDIGLEYSLNPYQGCEHGCVYCYARNTHPYWGYSAGLDFESKILIKSEAPQLLMKKLSSPSWKAAPIMLSGNTDCYQPIESKLRITRNLLEIMEKFQHPVGIITKNSLIQRDLDIIARLAEKQLVCVAISINTLDESLRRDLEPRTSSIAKRLETIHKLSEAGVHVMAMLAPIIPGLNDHEIMNLMEAVTEAGASDAGYTTVRLNGDVGPIFINWLQQTYKDRAERIINRIQDVHGGSIQDSRFGIRMKGQGTYADMISAHFNLAKRRFLPNASRYVYDLEKYEKAKKPQSSLFDLI